MIPTKTESVELAGGPMDGEIVTLSKDILVFERAEVTLFPYTLVGTHRYVRTKETNLFGLVFFKWEGMVL